MATLTEQEFIAEFHNMYTMHYANLLRDARNLALELGVVATIDTKIAFSVKDREPSVEEQHANSPDMININSKIKV